MLNQKEQLNILSTIIKIDAVAAVSVGFMLMCNVCRSVCNAYFSVYYGKHIRFTYDERMLVAFFFTSMGLTRLFSLLTQHRLYLVFSYGMEIVWIICELIMSRMHFDSAVMQILINMLIMMSLCLI